MAAQRSQRGGQGSLIVNRGGRRTEVAPAGELLGPSRDGHHDRRGDHEGAAER